MFCLKKPLGEIFLLPPRNVPFALWFCLRASQGSWFLTSWLRRQESNIIAWHREKCSCDYISVMFLQVSQLFPVELNYVPITSDVGRFGRHHSCYFFNLQHGWRELRREKSFGIVHQSLLLFLIKYTQQYKCDSQ